MPVRPAEKIRDAERSREAILDAAETLFARDGYEGASLNDIAAVAGLSRGSPNYFFGSKEQLYLAVLERAFAARQAATAAAFEPVHAWCSGEGDADGLRAALERAAGDYMRFLMRRPGFVALVLREELDGGQRMRARRTASTAMTDAFAAVRRVAPERGLREFDVSDATLLFISLTFVPLAHRHTMMRGIGRDLSRRAEREYQVRLAVDQVMRLLAG